MNVKKLNEYFASEFKMLDRGIVATPDSRDYLERFAQANGGSADLLLMQLAMNYGYKIALENVKEEVTNLTKDL